MSNAQEKKQQLDYGHARLYFVVTTYKFNSNFSAGDELVKKYYEDIISSPDKMDNWMETVLMR